MKNQSNFNQYAEETYGNDFRVHQYNQFVQISDGKSSGETISFHFNEKGFFDGAFYQKDLNDKGWGEKLFGYSKESKQFELFNPSMSEKISAVYNKIFSDMDLQTTLDKMNANLLKWQEKKDKEHNEEVVEKSEDIGLKLEKIICKVDKANLYMFEDKTFLNKGALEIPDIKDEELTQINGKKVVPLEQTEFKDRDIFECKNSDMFLLVDADKFKAFLNKINDTEKVAGMILEMIPELSKEEVLDFLIEFTKPKDAEKEISAAELPEAEKEDDLER